MCRCRKDVSTGDMRSMQSRERANPKCKQTNLESNNKTKTHKQLDTLVTVMGQGTAEGVTILQSSWQVASNGGVLNPQTPRQRCRRGQEAWRCHLTQGTYKHARAHKHATQGGTTACQLPTYTFRTFVLVAGSVLEEEVMF